ncbi:urease accessory protein UreF [Listeria booriae]|uniref:urease accessory protein UreF n=1 Tax=Listeria booriae TaxID=1552123 RepID=UPI001626D6E2|nr:urease accessory protein UreF [Listeria booriae]MBC1945562.1 urease accessory protein UreF [Listeria booriae]MBC6127447.1 urease accessory protein UreF [Listeria booriae]
MVTAMTNKMLTFFQLCDSNFPTGAFSHSFGFETYMNEEVIHDASSFGAWLKVFLQEQLVYSEGLAARFVYDSLENGDETELVHRSQALTAQILPREIRVANQKMGERFLVLGRELFDIHALDTYHQAVKNKETDAHSVVVLTIIAHHLTLTKQEAIEAFLYSTISTMVQNAVRGVPIGQTAGQKLLLAFQAEIHQAFLRIERLSEADFGSTPPGLEIAQMRHELLFARNFMS